MKNFVHMVMTKEVKDVLNEWADDWDASAKKFKTPELEDRAGFLRGMAMIGMQTGTNVNKDALEQLLRDAQSKVELKDSPILPKDVREAFHREAKIIIAWLEKHGIR